MNEEQEKFYLALIKTSIKEFDERKITLGKLVSNLESTIETLRNASYKDADTLWDSWGVLEEIYATELSIKRKDPSYSSLTDQEVSGILFSEIEKIKELCI